MSTFLIRNLIVDFDVRGVDSSVFMEEAWKLMDERGYRISNLDITLVLQVFQRDCQTVLLLVQLMYATLRAAVACGSGTRFLLKQPCWQI
jgi:2C-methyl-D-erythritol 2,4-cyclodiphosphate synthase